MQKPIPPIRPVAPKRLLRQFNFIMLDKAQSLKNVLEQIPEHIRFEDVTISMTYDEYPQYYFEYETTLVNEEYSSQLDRFSKQMVEYEEQMETYEQQLQQYEISKRLAVEMEEKRLFEEWRKKYDV